LPLLTVTVAFLTAHVQGQGIIYGQFPPTIVTPPAFEFPEDSQGTRLFSGLPEPATFPFALDGQTLFTFLASQTGFTVATSSSLEGVIAVPVGQIGGGGAIPLTIGQQIGPDALGYAWMDGELVLSASNDIGTIGYFAGLESAYLGLNFQDNGQTHYGWLRLGAPYLGLNIGWLYDYAYQTTPDTL
jgi:hypothetical protein